LSKEKKAWMTNNDKKQNGTIPKGDPQSQAGAADAQAARLRLFAGRRVADEGAAGVRYDAASWSVRRDGQLEVTTSRSGWWEQRSLEVTLTDQGQKRKEKGHFLGCLLSFVMPLYL